MFELEGAFGHGLELGSLFLCYCFVNNDEKEEEKEKKLVYFSF